jgi:hypothetical protein
MNTYLLALLGLLAVFIVGIICYGLLFKGTVGENAVKLTPGRFVVAGIGMYVISLAFIALFNDMNFASNVTGAMKGLYLGLLVGVAFLMVPLFADAPYFKSRDGVVWAVIINWVLSFAVLGLVVGTLA